MLAQKAEQVVRRLDPAWVVVRETHFTDLPPAAMLLQPPDERLCPSYADVRIKSRASGVLVFTAAVTVHVQVRGKHDVVARVFQRQQGVVVLGPALGTGPGASLDNDQSPGVYRTNRIDTR